ncbi:hypothetical protein N7528_010360 [Penicillium herquei]|nr:hypothetical protein N7528_010360 [Penicillium herquei]
MTSWKSCLRPQTPDAYQESETAWEEAPGVPKAAEHALQGRSSAIKASQDVCGAEPHPEHVADIAYQSQRQLVSRFLDDYLPPKTSAERTYQSSIFWVESFLNFLDSRSAIVETSLSTLTLMHISKSRGNTALADRSRHCYNLLLKQIFGLKQVKDPTDLIRTGMILALYETYNPIQGQENAWPIHVDAAYKLMKSSPTRNENLLNEHDLRRLYTTEFLRIWINDLVVVPQIPHSNWSSTSVFDGLLELLFKATISLHDYRIKKKTKRCDLASIEHMLAITWSIETQLLDWYSQIQLKNDHSLFTVQERCPSPQTNAHTDQSVLVFGNPSTIPLVLLYWLGLVIVYNFMLEALESLANWGSLQTSYHQQKMNETNALCHYYSDLIAQCQDGVATGTGLGNHIFAAATFSAAHNVKLNRQRADHNSALEMEKVHS